MHDDRLTLAEGVGDVLRQCAPGRHPGRRVSPSRHAPASRWNRRSVAASRKVPNTLPLRRHSQSAGRSQRCPRRSPSSRSSRAPPGLLPPARPASPRRRCASLAPPPSCGRGLGSTRATTRRLWTAPRASLSGRGPARAARRAGPARPRPARASVVARRCSIADRSRVSATRRRRCAPAPARAAGRLALPESEQHPAEQEQRRQRDTRDPRRRRVGQPQVAADTEQQQPEHTDQRGTASDHCSTDRRATTRAPGRPRGRSRPSPGPRRSRTSSVRPAAAARTVRCHGRGRSLRNRVADSAERGVDLRALHRGGLRHRGPTSAEREPPAVRAGRRCSRRSGSGRSRRTHRVGGQPSSVPRLAAARTPPPPRR